MDIMKYKNEQNQKAYWTERWEIVLSILKEKLDEFDFMTWIDNRLSLARYDQENEILFLIVDTEFMKAQLEHRFQLIIENTATEVFARPVKVHFLLQEDEEIRYERIRKITAYLCGALSNIENEKKRLN